jgi:hypothetical protein
LNEHTYIEKGEDKIALIGVENGVKISKRQDINKASLGVNQEDFKILMSHDPSHWDYEIKTMIRIFTNIVRTHGCNLGLKFRLQVESGSICLCTMGWFIRNLGRYVYV